MVSFCDNKTAVSIKPSFCEYNNALCNNGGECIPAGVFDIYIISFLYF